MFSKRITFLLLNKKSRYFIIPGQLIIHNNRIITILSRTAPYAPSRNKAFLYKRVDNFVVFIRFGFFSVRQVVYMKRTALFFPGDCCINLPILTYKIGKQVSHDVNELDCNTKSEPLFIIMKKDIVLFAELTFLTKSIGVC